MESLSGVIPAKIQFPNGCSCGINYEKLGQTYSFHLVKEHLNRHLKTL